METIENYVEIPRILFSYQICQMNKCESESTSALRNFSGGIVSTQVSQCVTILLGFLSCSQTLILQFFHLFLLFYDFLDSHVLVYNLTTYRTRGSILVDNIQGRLPRSGGSDIYSPFYQSLVSNFEEAHTELGRRNSSSSIFNWISRTTWPNVQTFNRPRAIRKDEKSCNIIWETEHSNHVMNCKSCTLDCIYW